MSKKKKRIMLTGGGTGGSVTPLLAIVDYLDRNVYDLVFVGTKDGVEKRMVEVENINYRYITCGKLRRYFSVENLVDVFRVCIGVFQSLLLIREEKPDLLLSAGSFVSVPVVIAAKFLKVPIIVHQMDFKPGLANLIMSKFASIVTVTFEKSLADYSDKGVWIGNPMRKKYEQLKIKKQDVLNRFGFISNKPVLLVVGGGTGSQSINELIRDNIEELGKMCQVVHVCGKGKICGNERRGYIVRDFLSSEEMMNVYAISDLVISRCGMGFLTELSELGKASILIPMPDTHQEYNAEIFKRRGGAVVLNQGEINGDVLLGEIKKVLSDKKLKSNLEENVRNIFKKGASKEYVKIIKTVINKKK